MEHKYNPGEQRATISVDGILLILEDKFGATQVIELVDQGTLLRKAKRAQPSLY